MNAKDAWNLIVAKLLGGMTELPTVPKTKKTPVWFSARTDGNTIFIDMAAVHSPSSKLSSQRKLDYKTFQKVYPLYLRREKGESVSQEVTSITVNQVYYFSLIKHLANDLNQYSIKSINRRKLMGKYFIPSKGPESWRELVTDPKKH